MTLYSHIGKIALISSTIATSSILGSSSQIPILDEPTTFHQYPGPQHRLDIFLKELAAKKKDEAERRRQEQKHLQLNLTAHTKNVLRTTNSPKKGAR
jgi:hypothetical protein